MTRPLELLGKSFGNLTVISREENYSSGQTRWLCSCTCGSQVVVGGSRLVSKDRVKQKLHCGCEATPYDIGGFNRTHGMTSSPEYHSWRGMKERCCSVNNSHYHMYGGRGISYDKSWENFENFFKDMGYRPENTQLDRINVDGNYCKENCRWVGLGTQAFNIRLKTNNKSGRSGVHLRKNGKYFVSIGYRGKSIYLGMFDDFESACLAREAAEIKYYGVTKE